MAEQVIPAEAVEAAAKAIKEASGSNPDLDYLRTILDAAAPHIAREAIVCELAELAELMEPFSGKAGLANDATRGEVAKWLRARLASVRDSRKPNILHFE